jgi:hypothetical protein
MAGTGQEYKVEGKRLERLFDYTKFHIGIYLSSGGALVTLIGVAADKDKTFVAHLVGSPLCLAISLFLMAIAGMAGGVIASSCTECNTYEEVWEEKQGPFGWSWFTGRIWARIEHAAFWFSALFFSVSILSAQAVRGWILKLVALP